MHEGNSRVLKDITLISGCGNLVPAPPHTTSGETATYDMWVVFERASSVGFCWLAQLTLNLGQDSLCQLLGSRGPV